MGSNGRSGLPARAQPEVTSVLVSLDALFPTDHPTAQHDGLVLTGWTPGVLHRWLRSTTGQWIGVVTILIATTTGGHLQGRGPTRARRSAPTTAAEAPASAGR